MLQDSGAQAQRPADTAAAAAAVVVPVAAVQDSAAPVPRPVGAEQGQPAADADLLAAKKRNQETAADGAKADQSLEEQQQQQQQRAAAADAAEAAPAQVTVQGGVAMGVLALAVAGMAWTLFGHLRQPWRYDTVGQQ